MRALRRTDSGQHSQLRAVMVDSCDEERDAEWSRLRGVMHSTSASACHHELAQCVTRGPPRARQKRWNTTDHGRFLLVCAFAEPECEVRDGLGHRLDLDRLIIGEEVVLYAGHGHGRESARGKGGCGAKTTTHLGRHAGMLDHCPRVGGQAAHGATDVAINLHDLFDRVGLEQGGLGALLDGEDDALRGLDADSCRAELRVRVCARASAQIETV